MEVVFDAVEADDAIQNLAYTVFMDAVDQLRSAKVILEETAVVEAAEKLIDSKFDVKHADATRLSAALGNYREARQYFVNPTSSAAYHASVCGLNGNAAVSKMRTECVLPFNSLLASKAVESFLA